MAADGGDSQVSEKDLSQDSNCFKAILFCFVLAITYVGSLYIWKKMNHRDHPLTVKRRFVSVFVVAIISPFLTYFGTNFNYFKENPGILELLGIRWSGCIAALTIPLLLTMVLFFGPLFMHYIDGICTIYFETTYWSTNLRNLIWLRNHIVAPFSEEFTFRACMLPILVPCFGASMSILICPLFFGLAHLHHLWERLIIGTNIKHAVLQSLFQLVYTTIFGMYSAYLFIRTDHFLAPFLVHAFCNHMGFPDFGEIFVHPRPTRVFIMIAFISGLLTWVTLLEPCTRPYLFHNNVYA
ncbi:CAAX prenyl protease 2-like [Centruroides sculpturatus]|uniref:CAAX prenyl protease 2-like n=1 Tax=Centruroides sculpturatus TaxID=218467 RepID=UPI000C6DFE62|nr:CAAX prenyl protease 2-like [Centruroides sculpturatus]